MCILKNKKSKQEISELNYVDKWDFWSSPRLVIVPGWQAEQSRVWVQGQLAFALHGECQVEILVNEKKT